LIDYLGKPFAAKVNFIVGRSQGKDRIMLDKDFE
jgi:hypothetical protein